MNNPFKKHNYYKLLTSLLAIFAFIAPTFAAYDIDLKKIFLMPKSNLIAQNKKIINSGKTFIRNQNEITDDNTKDQQKYGLQDISRDGTAGKRMYCKNNVLTITNKNFYPDCGNHFAGCVDEKPTCTSVNFATGESQTFGRPEIKRIPKN